MSKKIKKSIKKQKNNKIKKDNKKNIVFILLIVIILSFIIILSLNVNKKKKNDLFYFSQSDFQYITTIGLFEYKASLGFEGTSIIFFCTNDSKKCYDELKDLNEIAEENELNIEFINVEELEEEEKKELSNLTNIFNEKYYPNLLIIKNKQIVNNTNKHLNKKEIKNLFKKYEIIN